MYFGFKGGKGVATAFGILLAVHAGLARAASLAFAGVVVATRYVSLASMLAAHRRVATSAWLLGWGPLSARGGGDGWPDRLASPRQRAASDRGSETKVGLRKERPSSA